ncbi:DUF2946 family protein [Nitrospirillum amazonense]|uniref:DUF2946 family protein n=1 Tax=Nitrospirillum amazonense TaxID=28077 RepID=UPI002DD44092|nr:DUF2946 family protein [Nitrospirillum amazonense]MEC4589688.1 DUF2946 family protein [Nitrospirillum amazonense]
MNARRHHARRPTPRGRPSLRWAWLVVVALLLRGLIPAGFMPNPHAVDPGASAIILCDSVHDALSVVTDPMMADPAMAKAMMANPWMHHHHEDGAGHAGHGMDAPCVFAAVAALAIGLLAIILVLPVQPRGVAWAPAFAAPWPRTRPPGTRLARGPPSFFS